MKDDADNSGAMDPVEALRAIAALAPRCEEGDCADSDEAAGKHRLATHVTTLFHTTVPLYLCEVHAPEHDAMLRKAESKGCGKRPPVEPYVEQNPVFRIAIDALAAIEAEGVERTDTAARMKSAVRDHLLATGWTQEDPVDNRFRDPVTGNAGGIFWALREQRMRDDGVEPAAPQFGVVVWPIGAESYTTVESRAVSRSPGSLTIVDEAKLGPDGAITAESAAPIEGYTKLKIGGWAWPPRVDRASEEISQPDADGPSRPLVEALYRLRRTLTTPEQREAVRAVELHVYDPHAAAPRCGKPDPQGRACTLLKGHAHPNDHSGAPGSCLVVAPTGDRRPCIHATPIHSGGRVIAWGLPVGHLCPEPAPERV